MGEHHCSAGGYWDCLCGNDCGYPYEHDCLYHQGMLKSIEPDKVIIEYMRKNKQICDKGLDEVL